MAGKKNFSDIDLLHLSKDVPDFVIKLYSILQKKQYNKVISWNQSETEVIIKDQAKLEADVLPMYFRHSKMESFIRQLNMYGFSKQIKTSAKHTNCTFFKNSNFKRGCIEELKSIKRKKRGDQGKQKQAIDPELELSEPYIQKVRSNLTKMTEQIVKLHRANPSLAKEMESVMEILRNLVGIDELTSTLLTDTQIQSQGAVNTNTYLTNSLLVTVKEMPDMKYLDSFCSFGENVEAGI